MLQFSKELSKQKIEPLLKMGYDELEQIRLFEFSVQPGQGQDETKIGILSYQIKSSKSDELFLDIEFENPLYISQASSSDSIIIKLRDDSYLISTQG